jgi:hypothetical protein
MKQLSEPKLIIEKLEPLGRLLMKIFTASTTVTIL